MTGKRNPQWITIAKDDPRFQSYLENRLPEGKRAIPVKTYRPLTHSEAVTFKVEEPINDQSFRGKNGAFIFLKAFRVREWSFFLTPMVWVIFYLTSNSVFWDPWLTIACLMGVLFLNLSAFLINDSVDFESGADRISDRDNLLSLGLMSLPKTKKLSWILLILGGLLGLPSVWVFPQILIWVIAPALAALWFWCRPSYFFKRSFFGELLVCALYGFVLVAGFSLGISGYLDTPLLLMGWVFSILFLLVTSVRNFEHLMAEHLISSINFVHRLGFDRARTYLLFLWSVSGASVLLWQSFFGASFWVFVFTLHYLTIGCILWFFSQKVVSPLGSRKRKLSKTYRGAILSVYFLLMIQMAILGFW